MSHSLLDKDMIYYSILYSCNFGHPNHDTYTLASCGKLENMKR
jgi:hypothetical protein